MTMIEVVSPPLSLYMDQVRAFAYRYLGDADLWYELKADVISKEDDRDEFSFIRMALWDKLMEREFFLLTEPPGQVDLFGQCDITEPGTSPGSSVFGGDCWVLTDMPRSSTGYSTPVSI